MSGGGADELAALFGKNLGDRPAVLASQRFARQDHRAGIDIVGMQAGRGIRVVDDGGEGMGVDDRVIALDGFPKSAFPVSSAKSTPCRLNIAGAPAPFSSTPEDARSLLDKPGLKWRSRIRAFNSKIKSSTAITALSIYVRSAWQTMRTRQSALLRPAMSSLRSVRATSSSASTKISLHENRTSG